MEQAQIEELVSEIETRVDRLRSLYEQYFMGIEKMEPLVPKKDVERRFQVLRKVQIRNTALRFRFQMILQKYNTYQSYWMRIMRQIEDGTYKRDILRANKNQGQRRSAPPPKPLEVEVDVDIDMNDATVPMMDLEFDADLPTRQVDVPALRAKEATSQPFGFDDAETHVVQRPGDGFDDDPTSLYLPVVDARPAAKKIAPPPAAAAAPAGTPIAKLRLAQADPEKLRALAAQIKAKKTVDPEGPTAPPRRFVAEAPPIHTPPTPPVAEAKKPGPPPLNRPPTAPGAFKPLAPPMGAPPMGVVSAKPAAPAPPPIAKPAAAAPSPTPAAKPAGPPPLQRPPLMRPPTPAITAPAPAPAPKAAPPPLNRPPTAPGAFKPLAPPMNKPPAPAPGAAAAPKAGPPPVPTASRTVEK